MKEFAMKIWEMPADDFVWVLAVTIFCTFLAYEVLQEIHLDRFVSRKRAERLEQ